jgi:hypothetical protein
MDLPGNRVGALLVERRIAVTERCDQPLRGERIENHVRCADGTIRAVASVPSHHAKYPADMTRKRGERRLADRADAAGCDEALMPTPDPDPRRAAGAPRYRRGAPVPTTAFPCSDPDGVWAGVF